MTTTLLPYKPGTIHRVGSLYAVADRDGVLTRAFATLAEAEAFRDEHYTPEELAR